MKRYVIYACSLLAFLVFCSKSCETTENEKDRLKNIELQATLDSIEHSFLSETPSDQILRLLEEKAKQKLADLADYLKIWADKSIDSSFKDATEQMISELFVSDSVRIIMEVFEDKRNKYFLLKEYLKALNEPKDSPADFTFDSITLSESLGRINEHIYKGKLRFLLKTEKAISSGGIHFSAFRKGIDIIALRTGKQFGTDTLIIWSVLLGDMR